MRKWRFAKCIDRNPVAHSPHSLFHCLSFWSQINESDIDHVVGAIQRINWLWTRLCQRTSSHIDRENRRLCNSRSSSSTSSTSDARTYTMQLKFVVAFIRFIFYFFLHLKFEWKKYSQENNLICGFTFFCSQNPDRMMLGRATRYTTKKSIEFNQ